MGKFTKLWSAYSHFNTAMDLFAKWKIILSTIIAFIIGLIAYLEKLPKAIIITLVLAVFFIIIGIIYLITCLIEKNRLLIS